MNNNNNNIKLLLLLGLCKNTLIVAPPIGTMQQLTEISTNTFWNKSFYSHD